MSLKGKVALVTGAAQGLGKGFTRILLTHGAKVSLLDVNEAAGAELKRSLDGDFGADSTVFLPCDVTSDAQLKDAFRRTLETFGRIDIVCNNAGILDENAWERTVSINLCAVVRGTYLALQHMKKESGGQGGVIVNVASVAGLGPLLSTPVYTATKHGVVGFSRAIAEVSKVCDYGVRVNVLCPSFTNTAILSNIEDDRTTGQFARLKDISKKMLQDAGVLDVSEVAEGFLQLVTDEGKNGSVLMVTKAGTAYVTFPQVVKDLVASPSVVL
ncbi:15-hydroxyprostaglandin dehydrogenase [NAD(+)] [Scleropages formosus]|uniref:15-hydroxyprostaglandin dehydrogenase [NAD(+)] n=1 Tax=Scleropages formosus TaxID=113540 RepID=A0A8C9V274_SCLFO|nr:15-hydroxyprostaglandin dehydrogenase [NAD(+)]-like [Scleropages formosus]